MLAARKANLITARARNKNHSAPCSRMLAKTIRYSSDFNVNVLSLAVLAGALSRMALVLVLKLRGRGQICRWSLLFLSNLQGKSPGNEIGS